jgi:hypothetical protein
MAEQDRPVRKNLRKSILYDSPSCYCEMSRTTRIRPIPP